jgi:hypothetical protein
MSDFFSSYAAFWHLFTCAGPTVIICFFVIACIFMSAIGGEAGFLAMIVMLFFFIVTAGESISRVSDLEIISYWMGAITPQTFLQSDYYKEWNFPSVMSFIFCMINLLFIPYAILCFLSALSCSCDSSDEDIKFKSGIIIYRFPLALGIPYFISNIYTICFVFFNGLSFGDTIMYALTLFFMTAVYAISLFCASFWFNVLWDD